MQNMHACGKTYSSKPNLQKEISSDSTSVETDGLNSSNQINAIKLSRKISRSFKHNFEMRVFAMKFGFFAKVSLIFAFVLLHTVQSSTTVVDRDRYPNGDFIVLDHISSRENSKGQCGGLVELAGHSLDLHYDIPQNATNVSCIWILWSKYGRSIRIKNMLSKRTYIRWNFNLYGLYNEPTYSKSINLGAFEERTLDVNENNGFAILFFHGNRTSSGRQGLHVKLSGTGSHWVTNCFALRAQFYQLQERNGTIKYPPSGISLYGNMERVFIIGRVPEGKLLKWQLDFEIDLHRDYLGLFWLHGTTLNRYVTTGLGSSANMTSNKAIPAGNSFILTFSTGNRIQTKGFEFNYVNENPFLVDGN